MGILRKHLTWISLLLVLVMSFLPTVTVYAGYTSWEQVPAENKEYAKAFFLSLREEGISVEVATAMTARANSESGFDPYMLEGGTSSWEARLNAPMSDDPPAYGFLQMQDRSPGGRLGKMLARVESYKGGKGTTDKIVAAEAQAKAAVEEFKEYDAFSVFPVADQGGTAVVTSTGISYPIDLKQYGYTEPIDSWEKFKNLKDAKLATLVWTMSIVRPAGWAYGSSYQNDFAMLEPIAKEFGGLDVNSSSSEGSSDTVSSDSIVGDGGLPEEWDLIGMYKRNYLYESQNKLEITDGSSLSLGQKANVASIKEDIYNNREFTLINFLRTLVAFIGIWFFVWAIALIVGYLFDRSNVYFEFSMVSLLTAGSITVLALEDSFERSVTLSKVARRVGLALIIGFILISGTVYIGLSNAIYWINDILNSF